jgi:hypothetical protein
MSIYEQLKDDLGYLQMGAAAERFALLADAAHRNSPELLAEIPHPGLVWTLVGVSFRSSLSCSCLVASEPVAVPVDVDHHAFV